MATDLYLSIHLIPSLHQLSLRRDLNLALLPHSPHHARAAVFASSKQTHKNGTIAPAFCLCTRRRCGRGSTRIGHTDSLSHAFLELQKTSAATSTQSTYNIPCKRRRGRYRVFLFPSLGCTVATALYLKIDLLPSLHQLSLRRDLDLPLLPHSTQHARAALFGYATKTHQNNAVAPAFCRCTRRRYSHGSSRVGQSDSARHSVFCARRRPLLQHQHNQHTTFLAREVAPAIRFFVSVTQEHGGYGCVP